MRLPIPLPPQACGTFEFTTFRAKRTGIWAIDRGGDRKKLLEPLLHRGQRFVIRSIGKRTVIDRRKLQGSVAEVAGRCRLRHQARIVRIQGGQEKAPGTRCFLEPTS